MTLQLLDIESGVRVRLTKPLEAGPETVLPTGLLGRIAAKPGGEPMVSIWPKGTLVAVAFEDDGGFSVWVPMEQLEAVRPDPTFFEGWRRCTRPRWWRERLLDKVLWDTAWQTSAFGVEIEVRRILRLWLAAGDVPMEQLIRIEGAYRRCYVIEGLYNGPRWP